MRRRRGAHGRCTGERSPRLTHRRLPRGRRGARRGAAAPRCDPARSSRASRGGAGCTAYRAAQPGGAPDRSAARGDHIRGRRASGRRWCPEAPPRRCTRASPPEHGGRAARDHTAESVRRAGYGICDARAELGLRSVLRCSGCAPPRPRASARAAHHPMASLRLRRERLVLRRHQRRHRPAAHRACARLLPQRHVRTRPLPEQAPLRPLGRALARLGFSTPRAPRRIRSWPSLPSSGPDPSEGRPPRPMRNATADDAAAKLSA